MHGLQKGFRSLFLLKLKSSFKINATHIFWFEIESFMQLYFVNLKLFRIHAKSS
jgi:hypothetical protein